MKLSELFEAYDPEDLSKEDFIRYDDHRINHLAKKSSGVDAIKAGKLFPALWQHKSDSKGPWIEGYATKAALEKGKTKDGHRVQWGYNAEEGKKSKFNSDTRAFNREKKAGNPQQG